LLFANDVGWLFKTKSMNFSGCWSDIFYLAGREWYLKKKRFTQL